nr:immunoglobulin heavy chain junction region [Macaca mulatta]MOW75782.1 immunoglobulin heavy chain junction region [Macaca mulatta]MOW75856.1 immunoglobulin heavy chain junction region [Macaca mulatta]MOW76440.1 immunoglobulin heavy chain junction region [Macaca mulatta]MOW76456.1 immunoglobulin heavy chain junction region [Macaca mulatta]
CARETYYYSGSYYTNGLDSW